MVDFRLAPYAAFVDFFIPLHSSRGRPEKTRLLLLASIPWETRGLDGDSPRSLHEFHFRPTEQVGSLADLLRSRLSRLEKKATQGGLVLYWALVFLVIAIIAAFFGFAGIALAAAGIAKVLFFIFLVLFVLALARHLIHSAG
jgi:uncharacterized membrane protein YtjA (UPF0391 family)